MHGEQVKEIASTTRKLIIRILTYVMTPAFMAKIEFQVPGKSKLTKAFSQYEKSDAMIKISGFSIDYFSTRRNQSIEVFREKLNLV